MRTFTLALCGAALLTGTAVAQTGPATQQPPASQSGMQHGSMQHGNMAGGMQMSPEMMARHGGPAGPEYHQAMMRMHQGMMAVNERDPGRAWAAMMIAHHQGAVDTSRIVLRHTQDRELRRMAEETIRSQEQEIARLRSWLQRHGGAPNP